MTIPITKEKIALSIVPAKNKAAKTGYIICLLFIALFFVAPLQAEAYNNPTLKILLFQSSHPVKFSSRHPIAVIREGKMLEQATTVRISPLASNYLKMNQKKYRRRILYLKSKDDISVSLDHSKGSRRYKGVIEIRPSGSVLSVINHLPVETYLEGVLNAEISTQWPIEVVKAQAVISRTFALYKKEERSHRPWHLTSGLSDQVYKGTDIADKRGIYAIRQTRGIVVTYQNRLAQTFYHSNCGGVTEDASSLWEYASPYLKVLRVPYGSSDPRFEWDATLSHGEVTAIARKLGFKGSQVRLLAISELSPSGRVSALSVNNSSSETLSAKDFRRAAGYQRIQSLLFKVVRVPGGFYFKGKGNGHGVGLSQWSAKEMAERGYRYHEIIQYFYQGTRLKHYWK